MAIFGKLEVVEKQVNKEKFTVAFEYLRNVMNINTSEFKRLMSYSSNAFERIDLDKNNFALEQAYNTKERSDCFFESHRQYIDVQFILDGEEVIEVTNNDNLNVSMLYSQEMDLLKYDDTNEASRIVLKKGDVAIFYAEDAHMPCLKLGTSSKVVKTVVKVAV